MRTAILFLFFVSALLGHANDTLTRAQVYSFSIGDTFDYKLSGTIWVGTPYENYSEYFERQVIVDIYYSTNSDTLFIAKNLIDDFLYSSYDTAVITNL